MIILDGTTDAFASEFIFFATDYGIYTFDRTSATWSRITTASGLPSNRVLALGLDDGVLWVATGSGLASADVRVNDWQAYDLPGTVRALAFDDRYVWAGGDSGLARFDKFSETWQQRSAAPVLALLAEEERLWIATTAGVLSCDLKFDRIDATPAPADSYVRIIDSRNLLWFVGRTRLVGYRKTTASWTEYSPIPDADFSVLGDSVLFAEGGRPLIYDPGSDRWSAPQLVGLPDVVTDAFLTSSEMLFASDQGLVVIGTKEGTRQVWTRNNGLADDSLVRTYCDRQYIYALTAGGIQYFDRQQGYWGQERFEPPQAKREQLAWLDDAGAHLGIVPDTDIRLAGRAYYSRSLTASGSSTSTTDIENVGLSLAARHHSGRALSLYYDDSDKDQVSYGLGYRGLGSDVLHRANAGKLKSEFSDFDLIPQFSTLGANARLKRDDHTLDLQAGRIESALRSDFFTGRSVDKEVTRPDVGYARGVFYRIPTPVASQWDTVFADDRSPATNSPKTRVGFTVGGVAGDFDPLLRGIDYFVDRTNGTVRFLTPRDPGDALVLLTDWGAQVLQSESVVGSALRNTYFFGPDITPGSFELRITDTAGAVHALSGFGIDDDHDGRVDPAHLNHDLGFLSFPLPLVADSLSPSVYTLRATFRSQSTFYNLTHRPMVKNSETVVVDGAAVTRGADYVVDYTSGILLFLKKDVVTDYSQIDVRYSSVEQPDSWASRHLLFSAQPSFAVLDSPSSVLLAPGFTRVADENVIHLSGRAEVGAGTDKNISFVPQLAVNADKALAQDYSLSGNCGVFSAAAQYRGFGSEFEELGAGIRRYGTLRHSAAFSAGVVPFSHLRVDGSARRDYVADTLSRSAAPQTADYLTGKLSYVNPRYPNGYVLYASDRLPDGSRLRTKASAGYEFAVLSSKLKLNGIVQNTTLDRLTSGPLDRSLEYIAEATFVLPFPVQGSIRYRSNGLSTEGEKTRREDELRGQLNVDVVPGFYYTGSYDLLSGASMMGSTQDLELEGYFYNNLQVAPGRWWSKLSVVNFSVGTGSNFDEYVRNLDSSYVPSLFLIRPLDDRSSSFDISSVSDLRTLYGTIQLQPSAALTLRAKRTVSNTGSACYELPELRTSTEDELKAQYEPGGIGLLTAQFNSRSGSGLPRTTRRNVYLEWNMPWSELLRTRLTATYGFDDEYYGQTLTLRPQSVAPNLEALIRFSSRSYASVGFGASWEQRTFSASGSDWLPDPWKVLLRPAAGFNFNLLRFLYVQLIYQSGLVLSGTPTHTLSGRLTAQF
ncbi:hypothetical protein JXD38_09895 [candidate division WOR-3 bacterium]|nr:hypothetical protein [candidate division WOR-3 bacterium]